MDPNFGSIIVIKSFLKVKFMFMDPKFGSIIFLGLHMGQSMLIVFKAYELHTLCKGNNCITRAHDLVDLG